MRIENYANITSLGKTNVGDLMNRLNPGDVIRAKVVEITSDEAVLKLSDGTLMQAKMLETMNAKAGDTVMLTVSSKSEGTLFLESIKNLSQIIQPNADTLNSLLEKLQIKPDAQNMQLAAELLKAGSPVTAESLEQSIALLKSLPVLDAEKAVYITSKGLNISQADIELLSKLLEGDLKLGQQLKDIQALLNQINDAKSDQTGSKAYAQAQKAASMNDQAGTGNQAAGVANNQTVSTTANQTSGASGNQPAGTSINQEVIVQNASGNNVANTGDTVNQTHAQTVQSQATQITVASQEAHIAGQSEVPSETTGAAGTNASRTNVSRTPADYKALADPETSAASSQLPETASKAVTAHVTTATDLHEKQAINGANRDLASLSASNETVSKETPADKFSKLIETVMDLYVKTNSDKLASELDVNKLKNELYEKLNVLKATIQSSEGYDPKEMAGLLKAATQIDDTLRLFNQMNSSNIMYYQMPVSIAGHNTTAELYVMKRQKNKRKIDPHNTVMFISLDTKNIGRIETLLDVKGSNITVNLRTESKQIIDFIKGQIKDLYKGFDDCGYKLASIRYSVIDSATSPIQQEKLLSEILNKNYGKVDYRI